MKRSSLLLLLGALTFSPPAYSIGMSFDGEPVTKEYVDPHKDLPPKERQIRTNQDSDQMSLDSLVSRMNEDRVHQYGLAHDKGMGEQFDTDFITRLLPYYQQMGWNNIAMEGLQSLNQTTDLERDFKGMCHGHWDAGYGRIINTAKELGINLMFYQSNKGKDPSERNEASFKYLRDFLEENPNEKLIIIGGVMQALPGIIPEMNELGFPSKERHKTVSYFLYEHLKGEGIINIWMQPQETSWNAFNYYDAFALTFRLGKISYAKEKIQYEQASPNIPIGRPYQLKLNLPVPLMPVDEGI